jgi:hypothetical protein
VIILNFPKWATISLNGATNLTPLYFVLICGNYRRKRVLLLRKILV